MRARFTVLNETPIAAAIAGCVIPLSRSNIIWMRCLDVHRPWRKVKVTNSRAAKPPSNVAMTDLPETGDRPDNGSIDLIMAEVVS
jgi:hypothetical protein